MRLDDSPAMQITDVIAWMRKIASTEPPSEQVFREIALSASEHADALERFTLPKVVNPAQHWNPNENPLDGNTAPKIAEFIRASGPRSEAMLHGEVTPPTADEGVGPVFEAPSRNGR